MREEDENTHETFKTTKILKEEKNTVNCMKGIEYIKEKKWRKSK